MTKSGAASRGLGMVRDLDDCPIKDGFRLRGCDMTRIEAFTDAAFAFAVTLLVVTVSNVPGSYHELLEAMRGIPAFLASFAMLVMFWGGHWRWSRRFGLEDFPSISLSFFLIFVVLCYVYPLRYMFGLFMNFFSRGYLSPEAVIASPQELYGIFGLYAIGFVIMAGSILLLNLHAWRLRGPLQLSPLEQLDTRIEMESWLVMIGVGVISALLAFLTPPMAAALPAWAWSTLAMLMPMHGIVRDRARKAIIDGRPIPANPPPSG